MKCRSCFSTELLEVLDLGNQPWCNDFRPSREEAEQAPVYPLKIFWCNSCELVQLGYTVKKEVMFSNHTYVSGTTKTLSHHFYNLAVENKQQFDLSPDDGIIDIGGNDGTQLLQYSNLGFKRLLNVESAKNIADLSVKSGIETRCAFFNEEFAKDWQWEHPWNYRAKLINASGVFFHLEELHSVCRGIKRLLDENGVFVVQFMYLKDIIEHAAFDAIYHEHLCYYSLRSLQNLLLPYGLKLIDAYRHPIHGGSMMAKFVHIENARVCSARARELLEKEEITYAQLLEFSHNVKYLAFKVREHLSELAEQGAKIYAFGSPAKGTTMLNYCKIDNKTIQKAVELNELKVGLYTPVTSIPIVKESKEDLPDYYFVLSWNFFDEIYAKNKDLPVKWILPLPTLKVV